MRILIGVLLLIHGLIHVVLGLIPNPDAAQPVAATFLSGWAGSWLLGGLSGKALRMIGLVLAIVAGVGFVGAGLAMFGILLPHEWWRALAIGSSAVSLVLCVLFWNTYFIVGPVVAVGIIVALGFAGWPTEAMLGY
jgi:hypothetical protein